ncbi:MAG: serine hydrolase domain-containing protein [Candidatus Zixiibacteriota bacterium]
MRTTKVLAVITLLLAVILAAHSCDRKAGPDAEAQVVAAGAGERVDVYLTKLVPFGFSGAALIAKGDEVLLNKGYGLANVAEGIANTPQTIFSVGSITKQFTAAAIMKLEMMGKLSTGDPVSKYFDNVPPDKLGITLHHLLTHTSGVNDDVMGGDFEIAHRDETMRKILEAPLRFAPGEEFEYSNLGYSMLAAIVELASGMSYEEFLHEYLFKPSGMNFTGYRIPDYTGKIVAHWYNGDIDNGIPLDKDYPYWNYIGNGGILSTTADMLRWHRVLMGDEILSAEAKQKMYTPFLNDYAYGWDVLDTERGMLIQHDGGSMLGCAADFKRFVDSNIVIMLFSNVSGPEILHEQGVRDKVTDIVFGADVELPFAIDDIKGDFSKYRGNYLLDEQSAYLVAESGDRMLMTPVGGGALTALYISGDSLKTVVAGNEKRSLEVMTAAVKDDFEPMRILVNDDDRLERLKDLWYTRKEQYASMTGPLAAAEVMYSTMSGYRPGATETIVKIQGATSAFFYRMIWFDGKMIGLGPVPPPQAMVLTLRPIDDGKFFTYDISAARNIILTFTGDTLWVGDIESGRKAVLGH